jgi:hypothetical protein
MSEERRRILHLVADKKITVEEAERRLAALEAQAGPGRDGRPGGSEPQYLHVIVNRKKGSPGGKADTDIRVPLALVRVGVKFGGLLPGGVQDKIARAMKEKGLEFDLSRLDSDSLERIIEALHTSSIEVDSDGEQTRIFCE